MTIIIGLTGSIGSGKTFISNYFKKFNIPVINSDEITNLLLHNDNEIIEFIKKINSKIIIDNKINKKILSDFLFSEPQILLDFEKLIHPKINLYRKKLLHKAIYTRKKIIILEVPLLFEKKFSKLCDYIITIITPRYIQYQRVMARENMSHNKYNQIQKLQFSNTKKIANSDFVIQNISSSKREIIKILSVIKDNKIPCVKYKNIR